MAVYEVEMTGQKPVFYGYTGPINSDGAKRIASALNNAVNQGYDEAYLTFSSLGGFVSDGIFLYNHIRGLPIPVTAYNTGTVASIAVAVFLAAERRHCSAHSTFLIHPTAMPGTQNMNAEHLQSAINSALADDARTENILRERATVPDNILQSRRFKDVHISPDDAVAFGLVSSVVEFTLPVGHQVFQI